MSEPEYDAQENIDTEITPMAQAYFEFLAAEGYRPKYDSDGDVVFKAEGILFCVLIDENDPEYLYLVVPNVKEIEDEKEQKDVLECLIDMQISYKGFKFILSSAHVSLTYQGFLPDKDSYPQILPRVINMLTTCLSVFRNTIEESPTLILKSPERVRA